jgi:hypothetical protein
MGDHQRAIADFSESIRLDPKSSDAYYSRALARRDLGQNDLADADESTARALDHVVQDTYRRLPDVVQPSEIVSSSGAESSGEAKKTKAPKVPSQTEAEQKRTYEELKKRFEPGFGELRHSDSPVAGGAAAKQGGSYNDRYRQLLEQANRAQAEQESATSLDTQEASTAPGFSGSELPGASLTAPGSATPGAAANATRRRGAGRSTTWQGPLQPPLASPFSQRPMMNPSGQMGPLSNPNVRSPFQQTVPGATGFTPVTPFGAQARQQAAPVARPFGSSTTNRFSNPAVRPANPRDYIP